MKQGVNPKIVNTRIGHSNVYRTLKTFSHANMEMQEILFQFLKKCSPGNK